VTVSGRAVVAGVEPEKVASTDGCGEWRGRQKDMIVEKFGAPLGAGRLAQGRNQ
jgi:hypothetical protein